MYPCTFQERFPTGIGLEWKNDDGIMSKTLMTDDKISLGSVQWIDFMQNTSPLVVDKNGQRCKIISGWNSKEKKIGQYRVDGFCQVDDKTIVFEYDGCFWHQCTVCKIGKEDDSDVKEHAQIRGEFFKSLGIIVERITECQWLQQMHNINYTPKISPLLFVNKLSHEKFLQVVKNDTLYGFALVDIKATPMAKKFLKLNWPPILSKQEIQYHDLPEYLMESS